MATNFQPRSDCGGLYHGEAGEGGLRPARSGPSRINAQHRGRDGVQSATLGVEKHCVVLGARRVRPYFGRITESRTWITPFEQAMSTLATLALSIFTLPSLTVNLTDCPCTVLASDSFTTSADMTLPDTT